MQNAYSAPERECIAVVWELQTLLTYLKYEKFTVFKNHHALNWLFNITDPYRRLTRWILRLAEFDFKMKYKKGANNHHTDGLSRLLTGSSTVGHVDGDITAFHLGDGKDLYMYSSDITFEESTIDNEEGLESWNPNTRHPIKYSHSKTLATTNHNSQK